MIYRFSKGRLRFVVIFLLAVVSVIIFRIVKIQIVHHEQYEKIAKQQWHNKLWISAKRGKILDRHGNPLAVTYSTYTLGVTPRDLPEKKEVVKYIAGVAKSTPSRIRKLLAGDKEYVLIKKDLRLTARQLAELYLLPGVRLDPVHKRLMPLQAINEQFIGIVNHKSEAIGGVEAAFNDVLMGEDGWIVVSKDARNGSFRPIGAPHMEAINGGDLFLTIDSDIQTIVNFELRKAVRKYGAEGGVVIVADPSNGDILALSEYFPGKQRHSLYSSSCYYEPGSTFKLITDAYLLDSGRVDPYDVFYGEEGETKFEFGVFRDDHPYGWITFRESFVYSSNICTIKAVSDSDPGEFYRYILKMGFGGKTGVDFPTESGGFLREPAKWSDRSLPSIAIGQEIGTTPLQMLSVYSALANGGDLYVPRVALGVLREGNMIKKIHPVKVRKIFPIEVSNTLKGFCRDVVIEGTGGNAATEMVDVGGKTGTAQKADKHGYLRGKYMASFIGFAPVENPQITCLVILDEPDYPYIYGGLSAAPVFSNVIEGICLTTDYISQGSERALAVEDGKDRKIKTPSFYRLTSSEAYRVASGSGVRICCSGDKGRVYSQIPDPGTLLETGAEITLLFRENGLDEKEYRVPDLRGLTIRKARRILIECGFRSTIRGAGVVEKQYPEPGNSLKKGSKVRLYCNTGLKLSEYFINGSSKRRS